MTAVARLDWDSWTASVAPDAHAAALEALETGHVLFFPRLAFGLDAQDLSALAAAAADESAKNISFDPATRELKGTAITGPECARVLALLERFSDQALGLMARIAPGYGAGLRRARASFRPAQVAERVMSWRKDDRRLHIDAFPSRPNRGERILRLFSNIDPEGSLRHWHVGEPFEAHARHFLPRLTPPLPGSAALLALAGITRGRRSRYDHAMLQLHDAAKRDTGYQAHAPQESVEFPSGSSWIVFTDQVPHAALSGKYALEQTFHVDPAVMQDPARAPVRVLERLMQRPLV